MNDLEKVREALKGGRSHLGYTRFDDALSALSRHEEYVRELISALERFENPHVTMHGALVVGEEDVRRARAILAKFEKEEG